MMKNPLQNLSCKCKDWIFDDLGATKQSQKKTVIECKNSMLQYRKRELPGSAKWVFGEEEGSEEESIGE